MLRLADAEPLAVDRVWLPEELAAPLLDAVESGAPRLARKARRRETSVAFFVLG